MNKGWEKVADWYDKLTGSEGHYYQREIIIPNVVNFIKSNRIKSVLDLGCGQGVLARALSSEITYCGVDISSSLISQAIQRKKFPHQEFIVGDVSSSELKISEKKFDLAACILAIQDIKDIQTFLLNTSKFLKPNGSLLIVMNHPCYRIPRQSEWNIDEKNKMQSRMIKSYMSSQEIPITVNPGQKQSETVHYYHHSLSTYSQFLFKAGFCIERIEEWISNKQSTGLKARMENRARNEFPLFLSLVCRLVKN